MRNVSFLRKIVHSRSGKEIDIGFVNEVSYIESMSLDGPKMIISVSDGTALVRDVMQVKEFDEIVFTFSDEWAKSPGMNFSETFTVLVIANNGNFITMSLIASAMHKLKTIAPKTRVFSQRGISEIVSAYAGGLEKKLGTFAIIGDYHCISGERPSRMFREIAEEHGAHVWIARGAFCMETFAKLIKLPHEFEYHYNKESEHTILKYSLPSKQNQLQEQNIRSFTGWNPTTGRIKTSSPLLKGEVAPVQRSTPSTYVLGNRPTAARDAVDFVCYGNGALTAGMCIRIVWHQASPDSPLNEGLPEKVLITSVTHYYSAQKYYCRVKGAVALEAV